MANSIALIQFSERHFDPSFAGTKIPTDKTEFMTKLNELFDTSKLVDGAAPFVKHFHVENFTGCKAGVAEVTTENTDLLKTGYQARQEGELPVLTRYFEAKDVTAPEARFLDVVLYTKEQLAAEKIEIEEAFGIVSINAEVEFGSSPMNPITMMRNALGVEEGGNGQPLDKAEYEKSVNYWSRFATVQ